MSTQDEISELCKERIEACKIKDERSLKKICRNTKVKKASIDEKNKGFKELIDSDSNTCTVKRRNSEVNMLSGIKLKITPKTSENSRGCSSKKKYYLNSEKKLSETRVPYKSSVKTKDNTIKFDKKVNNNINSQVTSPRTQKHTNCFNNRTEINPLAKRNSPSQHRKESSIIKIHKKSFKIQKIPEPYKSPQEPQPLKEKSIIKKVRFADNLTKCNQYNNESPSMSSILISETDEWINPELSPPSLPVSDFVNEFKKKIAISLESKPKVQEKNNGFTNDKIKNFPLDKKFIPKLNLNLILS